MSRSVSVTRRGREVHNPTGRLAIILFCLLVVVPFCLCVVLPFCLLVVLPLCLILHPIFRLFGREGTIFASDNYLSIHLNRDSFRKA